jgi:5-methylcytosine-specific restriction endonuclease McrA
MQRNAFKCVLCGKTPKDERLVIDHITSVARGGTNDVNNLRTLCFECNHGKMLLEERKPII